MGQLCTMPVVTIIFKGGVVLTGVFWLLCEAGEGVNADCSEKY